MATTTEDTMKLQERFGRVLTGRAMAAKLVEQIVAELAAGGTVVLDFDGIQAVSPSFADELFGKLSSRVGLSRVKFVNLSAHLEAVASMAVRNRAIVDN